MERLESRADELRQDVEGMESQLVTRRKHSDTRITVPFLSLRSRCHLYEVL